MSLSVNDYTKYDLYNIFLMTKKNFNTSTLRKAYQRQILIYHPDKFTSDMTEDDIKEKYEAFHLINNAYTILTNEELKKEYDNKREILEMEDQNYLDLKAKFKMNKDNKLTAEIQSLFEKQMQEMNIKIEEQINNKKLEDKLKDLHITRNKTTQDTLSYCEENKTNQETIIFLEPINVSPLDNFKDQLSNMNTNRNIKLENTSQEYNGLYSNTFADDKYAPFDTAFTNTIT